MKLTEESLQRKEAWERAGIRVPEFDRKAMRAETRRHPIWLHFGSGSLFRAFHAPLQQVLLERGLVKGGVYVAETFDMEMLEASYLPCDHLSILVTLLPEGAPEKTIIGSIAGAFRCDPVFSADYEELKAIFRCPSLQLVTFTITEKGYALTGLDGGFSPQAEADYVSGPHRGRLAMSKAASLLLERYQAGGAPLAMVSTDNCSHNGEKLRRGVVTMAEQWRKRGLVEAGFPEWLSDEAKVSFPWTMIDKITPRPAESVARALAASGIEGMEITVTGKGGYTAPFVNAEKPQYLVIEDRFPNGRPPLEQAGVYFTDRDTVNAVEKMKVTTCLNPLHTALAVFGCLLGYHSISDEMADPLLKALVEKIGYTEGMPVVTDPGIIRPQEFIREVIDRRLPNPFLPDTPQRIAMDTSQKLPIRFGETLKSYAATDGLDVTALTYIPLTIAGWLRYLLAVDDSGIPFQCSSDPLLPELQLQLASVKPGVPESAAPETLAPILSNPMLFGVDLTAVGLSEKVIGMLREMLTGPGAIRRTLEHYLNVTVI